IVFELRVGEFPLRGSHDGLRHRGHLTECGPAGRAGWPCRRANRAAHRGCPDFREVPAESWSLWLRAFERLSQDIIETFPEGPFLVDRGEVWHVGGELRANRGRGFPLRPRFGDVFERYADGAGGPMFKPA